ncbi:MAG TPA: hypothetical protein VKC34_05485, partial [Blastocatellia bacterium]|nr:hypothetical protein [Blastocatellia bacterium]
MPSLNTVSRGRIDKLSALAVVVLLLSSASPPALSAAQADRATESQLQAIRKYIKQSWQTLQRSNAKLADAAVDPKFKSTAGSHWPVYVSRKENFDEVAARLRKEMPASDFARIEIRRLPDDPAGIKEQGL